MVIIRVEIIRISFDKSQIWEYLFYELYIECEYLNSNLSNDRNYIVYNYLNRLMRYLMKSGSLHKSMGVCPFLFLI
jgi:hypothetical protein